MGGIRLATLVLAAGAGFAFACSTQPSPAPAIPVEAAAKGDLSVLVGNWTGEYGGKETGRTGSIVFELKSGGSTANGDVLMWPKGSHEAAEPSGSAELTSDQVRTMPKVLNVSFVRAQAGQITGTIVPYVDPDCECSVRTVFVGTVRGDVIEGTFTTERGRQTGEARVGHLEGRTAEGLTSGLSGRRAPRTP